MAHETFGVRKVCQFTFPLSAFFNPSTLARGPTSVWHRKGLPFALHRDGSFCSIRQVECSSSTAFLLSMDLFIKGVGGGCVLWVLV